jgi:large subunit ribosomal protein L25
MSEILLSARRREAGRSKARVLRRQGIVPGVFYYHGEEPISVAATELALRPLIYTAESHVIRLRLEDGVEKTCILKDITFDPMSDRPTHFDLQGVAADEMMTAEVPVVLVGQSIGHRDGGVVDFVLHKIEVTCLPADLPEHIEIDITNLAIGDAVHVGDLTSDKYTFVTAADATIVSVTHSRAGESDAAATAAATEPELVGAKGKEKE